ncbi:NAD(P)H-binding protein [Massilia sp. CF038]|uniref:NAD(P)H-binding protein n=1 Tax=Massilia sp. CF038 TaxID=1881045 RepID=UPI00091D5281|nr:NAD(P)H-binding protein [Massilia sp. CF038]SHG37361.1 Nucleoside-diphosphate-sugar epimerase [Massilia sp. CF038]
MKTALVLGATGGVGGEVARRLLAGGWTVRALARKPGNAIEGIEWIQGDAMIAADVINAAHGTSLIVHAVNPPGYRNWGKLVLPMIDNTIAAARASGARVLLPGTIYNYGSGTTPQLSESTPQQPSTRKGAIRVEMERRLKASGVRALIVRAGDFFGPRLGNNWFSQGLIKPGESVVTYPGARGVGHAWAYLPDLADTMVRLVEQEDRLATFESFHFRGHWDHDGTQMVNAIVRASAQPAMKVKQLPWPLLWLAAPFVTTVREMLEMRYLWREPFALDNAKLVRLLGSETHTPLPAAVRQALGGLKARAP